MKCIQKIYKILFLLVILILTVNLARIISPPYINSTFKYSDGKQSELSNNSNSNDIYNLTRAYLRITTTTDWFTLSFIGEERIIPLNSSIIQGHNLLNLHFQIQSQLIEVTSADLNEPTVVVEIELAIKNLINNTDLNLKINKGSIGFSRLEFFNYNEEIPILVSNVTHFYAENDPTNPYEYSIPDITLIKPQPFFFLNVGVTKPNQVHTFYYPWYGNPNHHLQWNHWEAEGHNPDIITNGTRDIGATNYPMLGAYDSLDPFILKHHIRMAQAAGIDAFIVSWWGSNTFEDMGFQTLLEQASIFDFQISLYFETAPYWNEIDAKESILRELRYIYDQYSEHESFYKVEVQGQTLPYIYIYVADWWNLDFWEEVKETLILEGRIFLFNADTRDASYLTVFDGIHNYMPLFEQNLSDLYVDYSFSTQLYEQYTENQKWFAATVIPAFDNWGVNPDPNRQRVNRTLNPMTFNMTWDTSIKAGADTILITSFNEWHEGSEIENSQQYKGEYLFQTLNWRQKIDSSYPAKGNLTVLNMITEAFSMIEWVQLVYPGNEIQISIDHELEDSLLAYDESSFEQARIHTLNIMDLILKFVDPPMTNTYSSTSVFPSSTSVLSSSTITSSSSFVSSNWYFNISVLFMQVIFLLILQRRKQKK
ncbi:MAG: hypothetical protein ACXAC7_02000 [Candidatus Hodarchaeales archaeon]|jgi:hypothetical protein